MKRTAKKVLMILLAAFLVLGLIAKDGVAAYAETTDGEPAAVETTVDETAGGGDEIIVGETVGSGDAVTVGETAGTGDGIIIDETAGTGDGILVDGTAGNGDEVTPGAAAGEVVAGGENVGGEIAGGEIIGGEIAGGEITGGDITGGETPENGTGLTEPAGNEEELAEGKPVEGELTEKEPAEEELTEEELAREKEKADKEKEDKEKEEQEEVKKPAFSESVILDGVKISVSAPEGVFPENAHLSAESVPVYAQRMVDKAIDSERDDNVRVAVSYTFDIKVLDPDGNELQPADAQNVKVAFSLAEAADENLDAQIYHVSDGGEAEALDTSTSGETVEAVSDGFSYYTVEFTYGALTYVLPGGDEVRLSEIVGAVGLTGNIEAARSSNEELFAVSDASGEWMLYSLQSFTSEETLTVTIQGIDYEISVTDPEFFNIWVGMTQVTSDNMSDILHDGGSAKYDPLLHTLTLDHPAITGLRDEAQIYANNPSSEVLIITGFAQLTNTSAQYGIKIDGGQKLVISMGSINANGSRHGIYTIGDINISASSVLADGGENGLYSKGSITCDAGILTGHGGKNGIYTDGSISIGNKGKVDATGAGYGVSAKGKISVSYGTLTAKGNYYHGIYTKSDLSVGKDGGVSAEGKQKGIFAEGSIQVSGKAEATGAEDGIYSESTVTADGALLKGEGTTGYGIYAAGAVSLSSDKVQATGQKAGIYSDTSNITISKGSVTAQGSSYGIFSNTGEVKVCNEIDSVIADGSSSAVRGKPITLEDKITAKTPSPHDIAKDGEGYDTIIKKDSSSAATHVELISNFGYTIDFDVQGHGTAPESQLVKPGDKATKPEDPAEEGCLFKGWYTDSDCKTEYDFSKPVEKDMTLYAKWETAILIHEITVQNVPYPIAGQHPVLKGATAVEDGIHMRGIGGWYWYDSGSHKWTLLPETDTFDPAKKYRPYVYVNAEEGYQIAKDAKSTINGQDALNDAVAGYHTVTVTMSMSVVQPHDSLYVVTAGTLNVRAAPGYDANRVGGLKYGDVVEAIGKEGNCILIEYEGKQGWVNSNYLALTYSKETAIKPITYTVTGAGAVNVRADISTSSTRIGGLTYMKKVLVTGIRTDSDGEKWLVMDYNGEYGRQLGYVVAKYTHTDSSVEFIYEETEPEKNENAESAEVDDDDEKVEVKGTNPKVTMGGVVIWSGRSAIAHGGNVNLSEDNYEAPGDGTAYTVFYPDDALNYSKLSTANIKIPSDWEVSIMEMSLQADGGIRLRFGPLNPVTVSFETDNGSTVSSQVITSGTTVSSPETPVKEGYDFAGWYADPERTTSFDFDAMIKEDVTVYAKWTEKTSGETHTDDPPGEPSTGTSGGYSPSHYAISYNLNGGVLDGKTGFVTIYVEYGKTIILPKPTRAGYTFDYWEGSRHEAGEGYKVEGDHVFTAQWKSDAAAVVPGVDASVTGASAAGTVHKMPGSGDDNHIMLYIFLMAASLLGLSAVLLFGTRRRRR